MPDKMFSIETERDIVEERRAGDRVSAIALRRKCSTATIYLILNRRAPELVHHTKHEGHMMHRGGFWLMEQDARRSLPKPVDHEAPPAVPHVAPVAEGSVIRYAPTKEQLMAGSARVRAGLVY